MMIAKDEGLFDKNGLDVTLTAFTQIANLPGTLGKQFDFAPTTAPDMLNAVANGINLAAVAGETIETSANKAYQVLVRADGGINSPKDLAGKRIAGPGVGSVMHVALVDWVKRDGGDPSGIVGVEVPFPNMMDQLKAGRVDAVEQLEPFVGVMLGERVSSRSAIRCSPSPTRSCFRTGSRTPTGRAAIATSSRNSSPRSKADCRSSRPTRRRPAPSSPNTPGCPRR